MIQSMPKVDITLAEAEQNYKNQMFKKNQTEIKHSKTKDFEDDLGAQGLHLKKTSDHLQVVENNSVNKTSIRPSTQGS
jgi:hypothetical protein